MINHRWIIPDNIKILEIRDVSARAHARARAHTHTKFVSLSVIKNLLLISVGQYIGRMHLLVVYHSRQETRFSDPAGKSAVQGRFVNGGYK